jgi:hypothetical protein
MPPRHGRQDKPAKAETHRIEEAFAALYPLAAVCQPGVRTTHAAYPLYCSFVPEENLKVSMEHFEICTPSGVSGTAGAITMTSTTSREVQFGLS